MEYPPKALVESIETMNSAPIDWNHSETAKVVLSKACELLHTAAQLIAFQAEQIAKLEERVHALEVAADDTEIFVP